MQKKDVLNSILREYDKKRTRASLDLDARKAEIYDHFPRIKEIDETIAMSGIRLASSSIGDSAGNIQKRASEYKSMMKELTQEKAAILKEAGIPRKYLEIQHSCKICADTAFVDGAQCACLRKRLTDAYYNKYAIAKRLESENFDKFDLTCYSDKPYGARISPRKNMKKIFELCRRYVDNFHKTKSNLLFYGSPGLGKTFLCNCIAKELMDSGKIVIYMPANSLFKMLSDAQFAAKDEETDDIYSDFISCDMLIIDDLGTEFATILSNTFLFNIINTRGGENKPTILSTNLQQEELTEMYSERITSRIVGGYSMLSFYGDDIRQAKKF